MTAFSSLLGSGNVLVGRRFSAKDLTVMSSSSSSSSRCCLGVKAVSAANRESMKMVMSGPTVSDLYDLYRNQTGATATTAMFDHEEEDRGRDSSSMITDERMDCWIKESIGEIVRHIGEAPFLVQVFSQGQDLRLEREEALPESWPLIKKRWNQSSSIPDGVILVEEIKAKDDKDKPINYNDDNEAESQTWGLVVQGRGMDCAAPCYILNTCRVRSAAGFCTHFCLVRAKCFGESLDKQLGKAWLQGR